MCVGFGARECRVQVPRAPPSAPRAVPFAFSALRGLLFVAAIRLSFLAALVHGLLCFLAGALMCLALVGLQLVFTHPLATTGGFPPWVACHDRRRGLGLAILLLVPSVSYLTLSLFLAAGDAGFALCFGVVLASGLLSALRGYVGVSSLRARASFLSGVCPLKRKQTWSTFVTWSCFVLLVCQSAGCEAPAHAVCTQCRDGGGLGCSIVVASLFWWRRLATTTTTTTTTTMKAFVGGDWQ